MVMDAVVGLGNTDMHERNLDPAGTFDMCLLSFQLRVSVKTSATSLQVLSSVVVLLAFLPAVHLLHLPSIMQRPSYAVPPANSPPLHHPVPQHVSTVPQLRSPPPPYGLGSQQNTQGGSGGYGYGQSPPQGSTGGGSMHPAFGSFISDPTAQMGFQVGQSAVMAGQEYMQQNVRPLPIPSGGD